MQLRNLFLLFSLIGTVSLMLACAHNATIRSAGSSQTAVTQEKHPEADFSVSCFECHQSATPEVTAKWEAGKHGQVNVGCFVCHGDGEVEFYPKPQGDRCISCHSQQEVDFTKLPVKNCFGCHGGHDLKFHL